MIYEIVGSTIIVAGTHYGPGILNYVRHMARSGIDISGEWELVQSARTEDGGEIKKVWATDMSIRQIGKKITGKAVAKGQNHDTATVRYKLEGSFENGYADLTFRDVEKSRFSVSLFLLKICNNGATLKGHRLFSGAIEDVSRAVECEWRRSGIAIEEAGCGKILE